MSKVDARLNRGELQVLLAAIDCFTRDRVDAPWWRDRITLEGLRERFEEELKLLGE